jgi:monoamine oxidase
METPAPAEGEAEEAEPQAAARRRAVMAAVLQPADSPGPIPADERPEPTDPPSKAEADAIVPVDPPPDEQQPPAQDGQAQTETQPATQPATDEATTQPGEGDEPLILNGKLLRGDEADKLYEEVDTVLAKLIGMAKDVDPVRPWTSPNAAELDARSFASFIEEQQELGAEARALLIKGAEADNGVTADRMSLLGFLAMIAGGGLQDYFESSETYRLADGNDALATALAQKLGPRVHFNAMVDAVRRTAEGAFVRTRDGRIFHGDAVVLATPPSVWNRIEFSPPLAESLTPQMGNNVKLLLALREPVWERHGLTAEVTSIDTRPPAELPRPATVRQWMGLTWAATEGGAGGRGPVGLTLFAGAEEAEAMRQLAPVERNVWAYVSLAPAYPELRESVVRERFVDWTGFPLTRASYSFPAPGQVTAFGPTLVDGIREGDLAPLMFAGEHTAYGFIGYMEGALSSGVRVGRALLGTAPPPPTQEVPADTQPAETQPTDTQPSDAVPAEPVQEPAPQDAQPTPDAQPAPDAAPDAEPAEVPEPVAPGLPA